MRTQCYSNDDTLKLKLSKVVRETIKHEDGRYECEVSAIDSYFDASFLMYPEGGNLNKKNVFGERMVIDELERTCVEKQSRYNRRNSTFETEFSIPVIGFMLFQSFDPDGLLDYQAPDASERSALDRKVKQNPSQYLYWQGRYYDVNIVWKYRQNFSFLKEYGRRYPPTPNLGDSAEFKKLQYSNSKGWRNYQGGIHHEQMHDNQYQSYSGGWTARDDSDYLQIDLGELKLVTHIGTTGEPLVTYCFPTRRTVGRKKMRSFRAIEDWGDEGLTELEVSKKKGASNVQVLRDEHPLAWVQSYDISYKHHTLKKWVHYDTCMGNIDATTECIISLQPSGGCYTRYIRIRPLQFKEKPTILN
jgi:hypothetical protein